MLRVPMAARCPVDCLVVPDSYLCFARLSALFDETPRAVPGIHPSAVIDVSARVPPGASTGPHCSLEQGVEIGAGTCIDRGTLADTLLGRGVKIDNQVQIAHNAQIGDYTAIAGCAGIGGSGGSENIVAGRRCRLVGPLEIADHVTITAMSLINRSVPEPGS
ncbi:MAG: hypothetical protein IPH83_04520 [Gammaproteobacteria bacterium]|nr:hypothetical protein [Gammaproteobacteria bacterium]